MAPVSPITRIKAYMIVAVIVCMLLGLFFSRALLTGGTIFLFLLSFINTDFVVTRRKYTINYNILLSLLFLIPLISGLWSNNLSEWWQRCGIKLPFLLLPFAFSALGLLRKENYLLLSVLFIGLVMAGTFWSFIEYLHHTSSIQSGYLKSTMLKVWLHNDHVLFSWSAVIAIILIIIQTMGKRPISKIRMLFSWVVIGWLVFFLHLLAARTGLLCLYIVALIWGIYKLKQKSFKAGIAILFFIIVLPLISFLLIPTYHNRVLYVVYDLQQYFKGNFPPGFSDVSRIISYEGGFNITRNHFFTGVGFGDVADSMNHWYEIKYSYLTEHDRILPHNEGLMFSCGAGIFALLIFTYIVLYPFFMKPNWEWIAFHLTALICFFTDATLETQNGVFLYCFFIFWMKIGINYKYGIAFGSDNY